MTTLFLFFLLAFKPKVNALEDDDDNVSATDGPTNDTNYSTSESSATTEDILVRNLKRVRVEHRDHTYADLNTYRTLYQFLNLTVDMDSKLVYGYVETTFVKIRPTWSFDYSNAFRGLILDIGPYVSVSEIENVVSGESIGFETICLKPLDYFGPLKSIFQCVLMIDDPIAFVGEVKLRIHYSVESNTSSLTYVPPHQTHDKHSHFLVSYTQPSNARGWIPCQDTPALKYPYDAEIRVREPYTALMSATREQTSLPNASGWYTATFRQKIPTPPYLIAISVADVTFVDVRIENEGEKFETKTGEMASKAPIRVWGEKSVMEKVGSSGILNLIPEMLDLCEMKYGPYVWGRYDVVLTPPGYMFKGMEFPGMNYISSTTLNFRNLAGPNYAFADIIAHEMIHSWFGNLVTPKYASDAWLAEGITTWGELQLMEDYYNNPAVGEFMRRSRYSSLSKVLKNSNAKYKILTPYLVDEHPFDGFTYVQYNKGSLFLEYLANQTTRAVIERGLRAYLAKYKYQSVDTADFVHLVFDLYPEAEYIEREIYVWLERPHTKVPLKLFPSEIYDDCAKIYQVLTRGNKFGNISWTLKDIATAYKFGNGSLADKAPHMRAQMLIVLERLDNVLSKIEMSETRARRWKSLVNRLENNFHFTEMTETDPETFAVWAELALQFNHTATMAKIPVFFEENGRLELVFSILDAPADNRLRGVMANILRTSYDMSSYPGFIGYLLTSYVEYFIQYFEP